MTSRNAPCPCNSGKRYKACCGRLAESPLAADAASNAPTLGQLMLSALAAQKAKNLDKAKDLYERALNLAPDNIDALHMLGVVHFSLGDLESAERHIRHALGRCTTPVANINHNLLMVKEARAARPAADPTPLTIVRESQVAEHADACQVLQSAQEFALPGLSLPGMPAPGPIHARFPAIHAFDLIDATVDPESEFPTTDRVAVLPDWLDLHRHEPSEFRYRLLDGPDPTGQIHRVVRCSDLRHENLSDAVALTSSHWTNWAHFLTEQLPKVILAEQIDTWQRRPFVISSMCLPNTEELCRRLVSPHRQVIKISGRTRVRRSGFLSTVGYCPFDYRQATVDLPPEIHRTDALFSPYALDQVRRSTRRLAARASGKHPKQIYLQRRGVLRRVVNAESVEATVRRHGFVVVIPETLPLEEQIGMFSAAETVVGQAGAGLANMVFADPGVRILALATFSPHINYGYFANMAQALGHRLDYLFCRAAGDSQHPAHSSVEVPLDALDLALEQLSRR